MKKNIKKCCIFKNDNIECFCRLRNDKEKQWKN